VTTVVYLLPGADRGVPDAFRLYVGDRLAYEWRFEAVRLWEIDARVALRSGGAGPLALVPLMAFAARRYDRATFMSVLGKDRVMESWWDREVAEREARGQLRAARQMRSDLVKEFHPGKAAALLPAIEACDRTETLRSWTLQCAKLSDEAFLTLVTGKPRMRTARSRAARPSRRSTKRR
jgi:hypothetical protein